MTFTGTFTALVTPFRGDGSLDLESLAGKKIALRFELRDSKMFSFSFE